MKLNLGGNEEFEGGPGSSRLEGFTHVDIRALDGVDIVCDISKYIPVEDNSVDEIRASHVIEHILPQEIPNTLKEWKRILKTKGLLRVYCPDAEKIASSFLSRQIDIVRFSELIFGAQTYDVNFHKAAYTNKRLQDLLEKAGFKIIGHNPRPNAYYFDLGIQAVKL
jgi:predicted SAM-dependent methyltransferase